MKDLNETVDKYFFDLWSQVCGIEIQRNEKLGVCLYAQNFKIWVDELLAEETKFTIVSVNQAKVQLMDKYFEWFRYVPKRHQMKMGNRGHMCIFQVFASAYQRLKVVELAITPPLLFIPQSPQVILPPPPKIAGIFLGEDLDEKEFSEDEEGK